MTSIPISPARDEFIELAQRGNLIPVHTEFIADYETPIGAFEKIDNGRLSFLLESAESNDHVGRFSFLGSSPRVYLESRGRNITVEENGERRTFQSLKHGSVPPCENPKRSFPGLARRLVEAARREEDDPKNNGIEHDYDQRD